MSKILFRGKYKDTGEWVYWDVFGRTTTHTGKQHVLTVTSGAHTSYYYHAYQIMEKIDRTTVGQYTGAKDKNGKRIFEGDIVRCGTGRICKVTFFISPGVSGFDLVAIGGVHEPPPHNWSLFADTEVIGNIHDNPELLGGGGDG